MLPWILVVGTEGTLVFDELVDVVLGPVLAGGDFEDKSDDQQGLLGVAAGDHLGPGRKIQVRSTGPRRPSSPWGSASFSEGGLATPALSPCARRSQDPQPLALTCRMVKFSSTLFIMYFSGRCFSLWMKLIMYSQSGDRWMR